MATNEIVFKHVTDLSVKAVGNDVGGVDLVIRLCDSDDDVCYELGEFEVEALIKFFKQYLAGDFNWMKKREVK